jgi:RimJ/RimL family protein N-acetyltransferase
MVTSSAPVQVRYDERLLERSWAWLQDPEIKRLTDTPDFTRAAQRSWFESLAGRTDYFVWGIEVDGAPIGAFGIKHVTQDDAEYWGYLGERSHWGRGIGQWMLERACGEARSTGPPPPTPAPCSADQRARGVRLPYDASDFTDRLGIGRLHAR